MFYFGYLGLRGIVVFLIVYLSGLNRWVIKFLIFLFGMEVSLILRGNVVVVSLGCVLLCLVIVVWNIWLMVIVNIEEEVYG